MLYQAELHSEADHSGKRPIAGGAGGRKRDRAGQADKGAFMIIVNHAPKRYPELKP